MRRPDAPLFMLALSPGAWVIVALAVVSSCAVLLRGSGNDRTDATMWTFAVPHFVIYSPAIEQWNAQSNTTVRIEHIGREVMDRRMMSGFLGNVPTADLLEPERSTASLAFAGPPEAVGFLDLTDRLEADGLLDEINGPSFSPWTYGGRIFGIPHDVHPVMLAYRADLVESAGIDLSSVETWDDLFRALEPLCSDGDGDGTPDRFALSLWDTNPDMLETLLLQSGGGAFLADGTVAIDREVNAKAVAEMVSWMVGPDQVATDVPEFNPSGTELKRRGHAVCYLMPDWMCNIWRRELPELAGKVKLMPLPAWEQGGRRTSVWGGSMLGIARAADNHDELWEFAKYLYLSDELARELYRTGDIITPVRSHWNDPLFDQPDPYFGDQPKGRMYIDLADEVPARPATPFFTQARVAVQNAVSRLREYADRESICDAESLQPIAMFYLQDAQREVQRTVNRNEFHRSASETSADRVAGGTQ